MQRKNVVVLDKMEVLRKGIARLRQEMRYIAAHGEAALNDKAFAVVHNYDKYTEADLAVLSEIELKALREKLYMVMYRAKQRAQNPKSKAETRRRNETKAAQKKAEIAVIDRIRAEKKPKGE